jgi:hypothetical protein
MKQAVIALGLAFASSSMIADATTTVPKQKRDSNTLVSTVDIHIRPSRDSDVGTVPTTTLVDTVEDNFNFTDATRSAAKQDPILHRLDFDAVEGLSTPFEVPVESNDGGSSAYISSGTNGSAKIVTRWDGFAADHWFGAATDAPFIAAAGPLSVEFPSEVTNASLTYAGDGHWEKLDADHYFGMSVVLLDAQGNLVDSRAVVSAPNEIANARLVEIASSQPFQRLILTPSDDDIWFLSDVMIAFNRYKPAFADDYAHTSIGQTFTDNGTAVAPSDRCIPTVTDDQHCKMMLSGGGSNAFEVVPTRAQDGTDSDDLAYTSRGQTFAERNGFVDRLTPPPFNASDYAHTSVGQTFSDTGTNTSEVVSTGEHDGDIATTHLPFNQANVQDPNLQNTRIPSLRINRVDATPYVENPRGTTFTTRYKELDAAPVKDANGQAGTTPL